ncbi:MAG TPA: dienelactone hydrolase family protein [Caulobacteraceae bacterium]|jgi:carboxymethylenebutenolidase|nr:dienelactone hydrolase family protein [Caulobacteraceae bacterium]
MVTLMRPEGNEPGDLHLTRRGIAGAFFAGYAAAALSAQAEPIHTDDVGLIVETVVVPSGDFQLPAYVARPHGAGPRRPAILVASEIFGIHDYIKDVCRRLAKLGYVAIAPAFFARVGDPAPLSDMKAVMAIVQKASDQQVMSDVGATLAWLKARPFVNARELAITGFCWGGGTTWLSCETWPQLRCGVAWYGKLARQPNPDPNRLWPLELADRLGAPVLGLYGAKDPLAQGVPAMREALAKAGKTGSEIIVYPDAGHGFHADYRASYVEADAKDGWSRMLAFFAAHGVAPARA